MTPDNEAYDDGLEPLPPSLARTRGNTETMKPLRAPTWQCEFCGRFCSERTAKDHSVCIQQYDRKCAESMWP